MVVDKAFCIWIQESIMEKNYSCGGYLPELSLLEAWRCLVLGKPKSPEITGGFGNSWVKGHIAPVLKADINSLEALWSDSSCSLLSTSCFGFVFKWINTPVLKYLLWEVSVKC